MNHLGEGRIRAFSAGSQPKGVVHPAALELLSSVGFSTEGLRSKSWDEFSVPDAPVFDFIFTVCDNAAGETCPIWPGHPMTSHWGIEDPAAAPADEQAEAFRLAMTYLQNRISLFLALPFSSLDEMAMRHKLKEIGRGEGATTPEGVSA